MKYKRIIAYKPNCSTIIELDNGLIYLVPTDEFKEVLKINPNNISIFPDAFLKFGYFIENVEENEEVLRIKDVLGRIKDNDVPDMPVYMFDKLKKHIYDDEISQFVDDERLKRLKRYFDEYKIA